jgi:hypothetical protein
MEYKWAIVITREAIIECVIPIKESPSNADPIDYLIRWLDKYNMEDSEHLSAKVVRMEYL